MKAAFYTLGCKVNQYETEYMAELLKNAGFEIVAPHEEADYYIVNSCTVTATADQKTRQNVRKFKRKHPQATIILTGCMPQAFPENAAQLSEADIIFSNKNNEDILSLINQYNASHNRLIKIEKHQKDDDFAQCAISQFHERIRAFVKIEDGCDRFCSYCIIPLSRGRVRSKALTALQAEIDALAAHGTKEIVLVGINLSSYGKGKDFDLTDAVRICCENKNIRRVRLGSLEPDHLTDTMLQTFAEFDKFCPQFHISLQSGCNRTLQHMNRHYTCEEYQALCEKIRRIFPDATLTTDVMTGFHEETQEDFEETLQFVKTIAFEKIHVFPYSQRSGTAASKRGDNVPREEKEARAKRLTEEAQRIRSSFFQAQIGAQYSVLFESQAAENTYQGYTKNYIPVRVEASENLIGKELSVCITAVLPKEDCCLASLEANG